jgi:hypothetical protein
MTGSVDDMYDDLLSSLADASNGVPRDGVGSVTLKRAPKVRHRRKSPPPQDAAHAPRQQIDADDNARLPMEVDSAGVVERAKQRRAQKDKPNGVDTGKQKQTTDSITQPDTLNNPALSLSKQSSAGQDVLLHLQPPVQPLPPIREIHSTMQEWQTDGHAGEADVLDTHQRRQYDLWSKPSEPGKYCDAMFGNGFNERLPLCVTSRSATQQQVLHNTPSTFQCYRNPTVGSMLCGAENMRIDINKIRVSHGGESIDSVKGREESDEFPKYEAGAFTVQCQRNMAAGVNPSTFPHHLADVANAITNHRTWRTAAL